MSAVAITIQALLADATVTALVGERIDPIKPSQESAESCIVVNQVAESDHPIFSGPQSGFYQSRVQIDCRSNTATKALALGDAVRDALQNIVRQTFASGEATFFKEGVDITGEMDEADLYMRSMDFYVYWR